MALTFAPANLALDREVLTRFNIDYINWVAEGVRRRFDISLTDLLGMTIPDYAAGALDKLCENAPPIGVFHIVRRGESAVGMSGLRPVREGVAEIKRIYVPSALRGQGVGDAILQRLMQEARAFGYRRVVLESAPFMTSAHRLYEAMGFLDIAPYAKAEVPEALRHDWRFMGVEIGS